jgi:stage II sporulation protein AA (anti-sigma F factor antagonist)
MCVLIDQASHPFVEGSMQTGDGLQIDVSHLDGHALLAIRGEIDLATATAFGAAIDQGIQQAGMVILDFTGVTFMDSSGLNVLVSAAGQGTRSDAVRIRNAPISIHRLLSITGLDEVIRIEGDPPEMDQSAS